MIITAIYYLAVMIAQSFLAVLQFIVLLNVLDTHTGPRDFWFQARCGWNAFMFLFSMYFIFFSFYKILKLKNETDYLIGKKNES